MVRFISAPEEVSSEWLTSVLQPHGVLGKGQVKDVSIVLKRSLLVSEVARLRVQYSADTPDSTQKQFFLKLSKPGIESNRAEVDFYQTVAIEMPGAPLIHCYAADYDAEFDRSYILLEDCSDTHFQPESPITPSFERSKLAVECMAKCHSFWWDHPKLGHGVGKVFDSEWLRDFVTRLERSVSNFVESLGDGLSLKQKDVYRRLISSSESIWGRLTDAKGLTVTHGDMHWWNFLYPLDELTDEMRIFDWQLWHIDLGARDLAFLIALGGFAERRPELEMPLLHIYHESLLANGVVDYSRDQFWTDYRLSAIRNLNIPVIFWSQGRDEQTWRNFLDRAFESYFSLDCDELLHV